MSIQFTCANCGFDVPWRQEPRWDNELNTMFAKSHDACPGCEWSRHVAYGRDDKPPCGGMMEPVKFFGAGQVVRRCQECRWLMISPTQKQQEQVECAEALGGTYEFMAGWVMQSEFSDHTYTLNRWSPARAEM